MSDENNETANRGIRIIPFPPDVAELCESVRRFNARLAAGGFGEFHFSESHTSVAFPKLDGRAVWMEYFLAVEGGHDVRGGYILRFQPWWSHGKPLELVFLKLPVSEGVIDSKYAMLGLELIQDSQRNAPCIYALGMGGVQNKLPRILNRLGWKVISVPFYFRVCRASRVLRQTKPMRSTPLRRKLCDIAAFTGLGAVAFGIAQWWKNRRHPGCRLEIKLEKHFGPWCDQIWQSCHAEYGWIGQRNSATLPILYPDNDKRFIRMHVLREGKSIGWVLALSTDMKGHKQFGNLRVASLVDCLACPSDAAAVIDAASRYVRSLKPDLIVSNQQHPSWGQALSHAGYLSGPSNFALALSPVANEQLQKHGLSADSIHLNRGDGDGPINL